MDNPSWIGCSGHGFCISEALLCDQTAPSVQQIHTDILILTRGDVSSEDLADQS